jgi:hypothetical protein
MKGYKHKKIREQHHLWKGGRRIDSNGYVKIYAPEHPSVKNGTSKYVGEHILVMEKKLERYLLPGELVHHEDKNKQNNNPDNLELKTRGVHCAHHAKDMKKACGERQHSAKLTAGQVKEILDMPSSVGDIVLATRFCVSVSNIGYIRKRKTWKHISID